ncbi:hypothetical protein AHF37_09419 [Paragonimus kellicotti]|nr:hypothetical protein AHF37_09419 [Paragonimus kellicotti]
MGSAAQWKLSLSDKWLMANCDSDAQMTSFSQCICFGDPTGSGCNVLCVADFGTFFRTETLSASTKANNSVKLKVIAGMTVKHEVRLVDLTCGICTFNVLLGDKLIQDLAVASGPNLYVYRNLKPYFLFKLPLLEIVHGRRGRLEESW